MKVLPLQITVSLAVGMTGAGLTVTCFVHVLEHPLRPVVSVRVKLPPETAKTCTEALLALPIIVAFPLMLHECVMPAPDADDR